MTETREKTPSELATERRELKRALYAKAPLFVKMRAQIRQDVVAELTATQAAQG